MEQHHKYVINNTELNLALDMVRMCLKWSIPKFQSSSFREQSISLWRYMRTGNCGTIERGAFISLASIGKNRKETIVEHRMPLNQMWKELKAKNVSEIDNEKLYLLICDMLMLVHITKDEDSRLPKKFRKSPIDEYNKAGIHVVYIEFWNRKSVIPNIV